MSCNIEQAGIFRIVLYENNGLSVGYNVDGSIQTIISAGDVVILENSDCDTMELGYEFKSKRSANNKLKYKHKITWNQLGLTEENIELINTLKKSIYSWVPALDFYNGKTNVIINPVKFIESSIDNNASNHYEIVLENTGFGDAINALIEFFNYVFEDGNNYVFEDDNNFIFN